MVSSMEDAGFVKVGDMLSGKSKNFLESLLTYQLQTLEVNIPRAVEFAKQHGNLIEGASTNIYALPLQEKTEEIAL
jgi:thymidine kinase